MQIGGEILPAHAHHRVEKQTDGSFSRFVLFLLVAPPLQPGVVGPYPIWGVWFPSHLPLD
jgi:hypothetical protein